MCIKQAMDNTDPFINTVIARVLEGTATSEEMLILKQWLDEDKSNRIYFDELNTAYQATVTMKRFSEKRITDAWSNVAKRLDAEKGKTVSISQPKFTLLFKIAASIVL